MADWKRPSMCNAGACVEVWVEGVVVHVRSTERPEVVTFTRQEWADLRAAVKAGEYD